MADTRARLQALVQELIPLAEKYEEPAPGAFGIEDPLITKAKELIAQAQAPVDYATSLMVTTLEAISLRTLLQLNALQAIPASGSISLTDFSTKSGVQDSLLERLLRVPVNANFIDQDSTSGEYSHTHLSQGFTDPNSMPCRLFSFIYDEGLGGLMPLLPQYLTHQHAQTGKWEEPGASRDSTRFNIQTWHANVEGVKTAFEVMEMNPERMKRFQTSMAIGEQLNPFVGYYNFDKLAVSSDEEEADRKALVDVGGGQGLALAAILKAHPSLKPTHCVLQDTAPVIALAQTSNPANLPPGITYQPHDFFLAQPILNAKAYYLKAIAHDLSDANLVAVLRELVAVMAADSRALIAENVLPERGGSGVMALMDLMMMGIGGKERTEEGFRRVLRQAGLVVDWVHRAGGGRNYAIVEARLE
ncbi:hypothetical protein M409DRAFT_52084 [Zasmidium cellare ATCC 36951]|uniref:O-methyltransferase C-terminal domain-containing protein n=1 Tax=Zasmidium cellare ATCC 36951 TaxID=1080233 RepID=A0A6A6CUR4_ZASCE|nr:uncharacterized protein M409DRAFT_52084 [Zasmidium cellare ATCC 36951]KAF2169549.1 hypothetical protein M409DRAFT_52084 [Zasmidium cellare ATCC 36951]